MRWNGFRILKAGECDLLLLSCAYIFPASTTLAAIPAKVLSSAPASVHLVFVTFAVRK